MSQSRITDNTEIQALLENVRHGDSDARRQLFGHLYDAMKDIALAYMSRERGDHTLAPTALVHEAFLRLVDGEIHSRDQRELLSLAATAMRRVLIDHARRRNAAKRDAGQRVTWNDSAWGSQPSAYLLAVEEALARLETEDAELARVVELRFFGGLSVEETAAALEMSTATVKRRWRLARAWLHRELQPGDVHG